MIALSPFNFATLKFQGELNMDKTSSSGLPTLYARSFPEVRIPSPSPQPTNPDQIYPRSGQFDSIFEGGSELDRQKWVRALGIPDEASWNRITEERCRQFQLTTRMLSKKESAPTEIGSSVGLSAPRTRTRCLPAKLLENTL
jgi:hypothetical protein